MFEYLIQLDLLHNDVFMGIVGASGMASLAFIGRKLPNDLWWWLRRRTSVTLKVYEDSNAYPWINQWLMTHPSSKQMRLLRASVVGDGGKFGYERHFDDDTVEVGKTRKMHMLPGYGTHLIWRQGKPIIIERSMEDAQRPREIIEMTALFSSRSWFDKMINEVEDANMANNDIVFVFSPNTNYWGSPARLPKRNLDTVFVPNEVMDLVQDAEGFFNSKSEYRRVGIPWRRGYLFHGKPGTGKTTFTIALASYLNVPIYSLSLSRPLDDAGLTNLVRDMISPSILLIEDADIYASTASRDDKKDSDTGVSLAGLLNVLDGVTAGDGRLLIITSNQPTKLDGALVRPGRIDKQVEFGDIGPNEIGRMLRLHFPGVTFKDIPTSLLVNPCKAQEIVQKSKSPNDAIELMSKFGEA